MLERKEEQIHKKLNQAEEELAEVERVKKLQIAQLEKISGMTASQAKDMLLDEVRNDVKHDAALLIKSVEEQAKEEAEQKAKNIITGAIQRCAADHVTETTVSVVQVPNDEMKGRIIGREGRNIRTLETLTGIDLISTILRRRSFCRLRSRKTRDSETLSRKADSRRKNTSGQDRRDV